MNLSIVYILNSSKNKKMKITIVTSTLNSEKSIAYTLSSVFTQTYKNIEHIVIDGGSTDGSLKYCKKHKGIKKFL